MTKNGLDIQTISTKRTDFQTDRVLLLGQVTEKQEKATPSDFLKFLLASRTSGTFGFAPTHKADASQNQKSHFLANAQRMIITVITRLNLYFNRIKFELE
jgi:RPA family protein